MSLRDVLARNVVGRRVAAGLIVLGIAAGSAAVVVPLTDSDSAGNAFELRVVSEAATTIRFAWDPQPGFGYLFSLNGQLVSRTNDPSRSEVKFSKGDSYEVAVIAKGAVATYPPVVTPPPPTDTEPPPPTDTEPPPPPPTETEPLPVPPPPSYVHDYTAARGQTTPPDYGWDWGMQYTSGNATFAILPDGISPGLPSGRLRVAATSANEAVEGLRKYTMVLGARFFYGYMVKFPTNWQTPSPAGWGAAINQLGYQGCAESTTGSFAHSDHVQFVILSGEQVWPNGPGPNNTVNREYNNSTEGGTWPSAPRIIPAPMAKGVWHQLIYDIQWSPVSTTSANYSTLGVSGHVRVYHKLKGETTWTKTLERLDIPTLQWGPCRYGGSWPLDPTGSNVAHKFGLYAGAASFTREVEHGNISIGTTFESVATLMP